MMNEDNDRALQKLLMKAKITFILGGPASGKGTQCEKLVEEFGYTHISTGDLMRAEIAKGTKEGLRISKIVADGGLVPFETTVQLLKKGMLATPSKNYLIDGFPRAVDQATYFEQNVVETQQVLFYDVPQELMVERCMKRAETSGRADDNEETIKKRIQQFVDQSMAVVDYYSRFGKVRRIDATGSISEVYAQSKDAVLPQTELILGIKGSGKTTVAKDLCERTNAAYLNFLDFAAREDMQDIDEEELVGRLIQALAEEPKPRVVMENFPQNLFQAKFFIRNCKAPNNVFLTDCSQDVCQSRMTAFGENHPCYVSSMELGVKLKEFHASAATLLPYLKSAAKFTEVNTDQAFEQTMELVNKCVEPTVIHIRPGATAATNELRKEITERLSKDHGYMNLDVISLQKDEEERRTAIGCEMSLMKQAGKKIPPEMLVRMLKKIVYSGNPQCCNFILSSFPEIIEDAKAFELNCARIKALVYSTSQDKVVELKGNNLSLFNIDSLFQKEFRLRTMDCWDYDLFCEKMGNLIEYGIVIGRSLSGKTEICAQLRQQGYKIVDMKAMTEQVKVKLTPEDGEFEGEVPIADVEKEVADMINASRGSAVRTKFIFDGYTHPDADKFLEFISQFGLPQFVVHLTADVKQLKIRWSKKNEDADFPEEGDAVDEFQAQGAADVEAKAKIHGAYCDKVGRVECISLDTSKSLEGTKKDLKTAFAPKVIIVNHEKKLGVDVICANLAIKFNMLYISVYQLIRQHIQANTSWGKQLCEGRRPREITLPQNVGDEFEEGEYSAVHFNQKLVMDLINHTVAENRTNQRFIILEGVCNSTKLACEADRLELRLQDELNDIEANVGQIQSIIGLQFVYEPEAFDTKNVEFEKFAEAPKKEEVKKVDEDGNPIEEAPEDPDAPKKERFKPEMYKWTKTDKLARNLPQCFINAKSKARVNFDHKMSSLFSSSMDESCRLSLDEFIQHTCNKADEDQDKGKPFCYRQIIFEQ